MVETQILINGHFNALVPHKTLLLDKWKKKKIKRVIIGQKCKQL